MDPINLPESLARTFGRAWLQLTTLEQYYIVRDCVEDGGVSDLAEYKRNIGTGNLGAYAKVMAVRFSKARR